MNEAAVGAEGTEEPRSPHRRYIKIVIGVILGLGLVYVVNLALGWHLVDRFIIWQEINGLHSHNPKTRKAHLERLKNYGERDVVIEELTDALGDEDKSFDVRVQCARLLYKHFNRLGALEQLLQTGPLTARCPILTVLAPEAFFSEEIAANPALHVKETVLEWLKHEGDMTRMHAIQLAVRLELKEALPLIRPLARRSGRPATNMRYERDIMIAAAGAMVSFDDCEHLSDLVESAKSDPAPLVRLRFIQVLDRAGFQKTPVPPCPDAIAEDVMRGLVIGALDDVDKAVRMGALLILTRRPAWAKAAAARVREILDDHGLTGPERRHALEVLARLGDPADIERFPMWFHDPAPEVRSSAVGAVETLDGHHLEGCWIGIVEEETEKQLIFHEALDELYRFAKERVGFPEALTAKAANNPGAFRQVEANLFAGQTVSIADMKGGKQDISRHTVAEAWFRWWCKHREVAEADIGKAVAARRAFYEAKARGDVATAREALDGLGFSEPQGLFAYERGWLATR